jgi:CubicO group peptidase (beta-lactamase class C family)
MFEAYHGVTGAEHQANFNRLVAHGYRMISLSVYGDPADARYAAVWVQRQGTAWVAVHGVASAGFQSFFDLWTARGYVPVLISATGPATTAIFAGVFEQGITGPWLARHGMTSGLRSNAGTFQHQNAMAFSQNMIVRSFAIYGSMNDRRYAAVWLANPGFVKWNVHPADTAADYQVSFDAETQLPGYQLAGYRPAFVALSADQIYCSVFKDDVVGPWVARHDMTSAEYQAEFDQQKSIGFYPICVQGGGIGSQTRYAAIFAQDQVPLARQWAVGGSTAPALAGIDHIMQTFMQTNAVRAAQVTVAKYGTIRFARAYTWAEPGYRPPVISDRFLLASCSKIFTEAAIQSLFDANILAPAAAAYPLLSFSGPADPRSDTITIQQLLDHMAGYDDEDGPPTGSGFDPTYSMRKIAVDQNLNHPATKLDIARYMYARPLDFEPGAKSKYSNYGYLLLSAIVEQVTGLGFFDYVKQNLLEPAGISEVLLSSTLAGQRAAEEAICEDQDLGYSPIDLSSQLYIPAVYGGDGQIKEIAAGCAGLAASATALTQFIYLHAVWGNGPRSPNMARAGSTPGASTWAESRADGVDWAYVINTRDWPPQKPSPMLSDLAPLINNLLDTAPI